MSRDELEHLPIVTEPLERQLASAGQLRSGIGLCLSGGGYRAMLFHLGSLWRLNELGYLPKLDRISSVSGGSITAGVLGVNWSSLTFNGEGKAQNFQELIVEPVKSLAGKTIDIGAVIGGVFGPGSVGDWIAKSYRRHLFGPKTLQDLPDRPRFVINATNVQSGVLWRFSKPYMWDYRVGQIREPSLEIAVAVAASSAFPPLLSPVGLTLEPATFTSNSGTDLQFEPYRSKVVLTDGGVYDNLGLETVWKEFDTVLVSDAGGKMSGEPIPNRDWIRHSVRVLSVIDNQVRSLRKRQLIDSFSNYFRKGAYWGIRTNITNYQLSNAMNCPFEKTLQLADVATRLKRLDTHIRESLINWGYAVCDAAMRKHVDTTLDPPLQFPYSRAGVG